MTAITFYRKKGKVHERSILILVSLFQEVLFWWACNWIQRAFFFLKYIIHQSQLLTIALFVVAYIFKTIYLQKHLQ